MSNGVFGLIKVLRIFRRLLRDNFIAGLLAVIPAALTVACLAWVWQQIDGPLSRFFQLVSGGSDADLGPWTRFYRAVSDSQYEKTIGPLIGLVLIVIAIMLVGLVMRSIVGRFFLSLLENAISRVPLIGMLYSSIKQLGEAFITKEGHSKFQRAVAVQFPMAGSWAIGFVTGPGDSILRHVPKEKNTLNAALMLTVFVPTTPLPTAGFMLVVPACDTLELNMTVQDALRMVVSGGMIAPGDSHKLSAIKKESLAAALENVPALASKRESEQAGPVFTESQAGSE